MRLDEPLLFDLPKQRRVMDDGDEVYRLAVIVRKAGGEKPHRVERQGSQILVNGARMSVKAFIALGRRIESA